MFLFLIGHARKFIPSVIFCLKLLTSFFFLAIWIIQLLAVLTLSVPYAFNLIQKIHKYIYAFTKKSDIQRNDCLRQKREREGEKIKRGIVGESVHEEEEEENKRGKERM